MDTSKRKRRKRSKDDATIQKEELSTKKKRRTGTTDRERETSEKRDDNLYMKFCGSSEQLSMVYDCGTSPIFRSVTTPWSQTGTTDKKKETSEKGDDNLYRKFCGPSKQLSMVYDCGTSPIFRSVTTPRSRTEINAGSECNPNSTDTLKGEDEFANQHIRTHSNVNKRLREYLQKNFIDLKQEVESDTFADSLYCRDVLKDEQRSTVQGLTDRGRKNEYILMCIVRFSQTEKASNVSLVQILEDAFKTSDSMHLFQDFDINMSVFEESEDEKRQCLLDDGQWKRKLDAFHRLKGDDINTTHILDQLLSQNVINFDEFDDIKNFKGKLSKKFGFLIAHLRDKTVIHYEKFVKIITTEYAEHADGFDDNNLMEDAFESAPLACTFENLHLQKHSASDTDVSSGGELTLQSEGDGRRVEKRIVKRISNQMNRHLYEQNVEFAAQRIEKITFSSVHIRLIALSKRSQMRALRKSLESPQQFLQLVQSVFEDKDIRCLQKKGITKVHVKLSIVWPDCPLTKRFIVNNFCFLVENMPDVSEFMVAVNGINLESLKDMTDTEKNAAILIYVVNSPRDLTFLLYKAFKKLDPTAALEAIKNYRLVDNGESCCRLSKVAITKNWSLMTEKMKELKEILKRFVRFYEFKQCDREDFQKQLLELECCDHIKCDDSNFLFLRKILDINYDQIECCLLEEALHESEQEELLRQIMKQDKKDAENEVKKFALEKEDIDRNKHIIIKKLEPRPFADILKDDKKVLAVKGTDCRQQRCQIFLDALTSDPDSLEKFDRRLQIMQLQHITDIFREGRKQGSSEEKLTADDIQRNTAFLKENINPEILFEPKQNMAKNSDENSEKIQSAIPACQRSSYFWERLLNNPDADTLELFRKTLSEFKMNHIYKYLINSRDMDPLQEKMKEAVINLHAEVIDEIEPKRLKPVFVERKVISDDEFNELLGKSMKRRDQAILLLQTVLDGKPSKVHCLINAMEAAGYWTLVQNIYEEMDMYHSCPRLYKRRHCKEDVFTVEGDIGLPDPRDLPESRITTTAGPRLPTLDRMSFTEHWINSGEGLSFENLMGVSYLPVAAEEKTESSIESGDKSYFDSQKKLFATSEEKRGNKKPSKKAWSPNMLSVASISGRNFDESFSVSPNSLRGMQTRSKKTFSVISDKTLIYDEDTL